MFITVRFGNDERALFNLLCRTKVLYENIKLRCKCQKEDVIDLAEESTGMLKVLPERPTEQYANEYLPNRGTFVLVKVSFKKTDESTGKQLKAFDPLLVDANQDFLSKLYNRKNNPDAGVPVQKLPSMTKPHQSGTRRMTKPRSPLRASSLTVSASKSRSPSRNILQVNKQVH